MKFYSDDGKIFDSAEDCLAHEKTLEDERTAAAKKEEERKAELEEIQKLVDELGDKMDVFYEKYGHHVSLKGTGNSVYLFPALWEMLGWDW